MCYHLQILTLDTVLQIMNAYEMLSYMDDLPISIDCY